jgi:acyl-CoA thioesterase-1
VSSRLRLSITALALVLLGACSLRTVGCGNAPDLGTEVSPKRTPFGGEPAPVAAKFKIAFFGDSITAGFGLLSEQAYPVIIQNMFANDGYREVESVNAGLTGDTTASGLRRVDEVFEPEVRILVIALGGNDALRGLAPQETHDNLARIIDRGLSKNVAVVLVGMMAPPNLGPDYREAFSAAFVKLATEYRKKITYIPFLLEGVAGNPSLNQADGIHPSPEGAKIVATTLYQPLRILVDSMQ